MTTEAFRKLALGYPETTEEPHFEKTSFRVRKKDFRNHESGGKTNMRETERT